MSVRVIQTVLIGMIGCGLVAPMSATAGAKGPLLALEMRALEPVSTSTPAVWSCHDLRDIVRAYRREIKSVMVAMSWVDMRSDAQARRGRCLVALSGGRAYVDWQSDDGQTRVGFDGDGTWQRRVLPAAQDPTWSTGRHMLAVGRMWPFFAYNLLNVSPDEATAAVGPADLATLLAGDVAIRPQQERIGARLCHVVDTPRHSLWLDVDRGCIPLRREVRKRAGTSVFAATSTHHLGENLWVVSSGCEWRNDAASRTLRLAWQLDGLGTGVPLVLLNRPLPPAFFAVREIVAGDAH